MKRGVASANIVATGFNPLIIANKYVENRRFGPYISYLRHSTYCGSVCQRVETRCYKICQAYGFL